LYVNVGDNVMFNGSSMAVVTDIIGTNGVVHVVDVLLIYQQLQLLPLQTQLY